MSALHPVLSICSRCGSHLTAATGGLCLRCVGERALGLGPGGEPPPDSLDTSSVPSSDGGAGIPRPPLPTPPRHLGAYEIIEEIGRGGMGVVYAARHTSLGRIVALKVITTGGQATAEQEMRFVREAQTAARLRHPHIVTVHDAGCANRLAYYTMDLVPDGDLAQRLHARPLPPAAAAALLRKVAAAVAYAHDEGVLHRDLKPSNILLEGDEPRVSDFGLAAQLESGAQLTVVTRMLGTPAYLAPEVYTSGTKAASPASDLYALGAILYEMLTGRPPFFGSDLGAAPALIAGHEPVAPRLLAPGVPRDLETIALKCLEKNPAARYATAGALAEDLQRFLENRPIVARPVSAIGHFSRWCRRRPALAAVWFLVLALAAGSSIAAVLIARARSETRTQLWSAKISEGQAQSLIRRAGRRAAALDALEAAARINATLEVRNAAVAALALTDVELVQRWPIKHSNPLVTFFDPAGQSYLLDLEDAFSWRETGTDRERARVPFDPDTSWLGLPALSPDGNRAIWRLGNGTVHLWEWNGSTAVRRWRLEHRPHPWPEKRHSRGGDLAFSPDGRSVAMAHPDGGVVMHAVDDGRELGRWSAEWLPNRVRFSPDGKFFAAVSTAPAAGGRGYLVDAATLTTVRPLDLGGNPFDLAWSISGELLAVSTDALEVRVFRPRDGAVVQTLPIREGTVARLRFLGGDEALLMSTFERANRWRWLRSGEEFLRIEDVEPGGFVVMADGREFFTTDGKDEGRRYRVTPPTGLRTVALNRERAGTSTGMTGGVGFSRDGAWLVGTHSRQATVFRVADLAAMAEIVTNERAEDVTAVFSADGTALLTCGSTRGLRRHPLHHAADGNTLTIDPPETINADGDFYLRDLSADGGRLVLLAPENGRVRIFNTERDGTAAHLAREWIAPGAFGAAFGPSGTHVLINHVTYAPGAADATLRLWDATTGQAVATLDAPALGDVDWNENASVAITGNGTRRSELWHAGTWTKGAALPAETQGDTSSFAIAPDGRTVAIGVRTGVHLVDVATGRTLVVLNPATPLGYITATQFSPDGHLLAALNADTQLYLWDLPVLRTALRKLGLDW